MQYLLDTDWVIEALQNRPEVTRHLKGFAPADLALSVISIAELYDGVFGSRDPEKSARELEAFLQPIKILPVDEPICHIFARVRHRLRVAGNLIPDMDLLIGATAIHHNLTVLTNNRRHFHRLQDITILSA